MIRHSLKGSAGFTIVELMIATTVLSIILLLATLVMTGIGNLYTKGINQSSVQDSARSIIDDVSQNLELSNGYTTATSGSVKAYCIGNARYTFMLNAQIVTDTPHVLWRDAAPAGGCSTANLSSPGSGTELIPSHSRLTEFSISATSPYDITAKVVFGDKDLLCNSAVAGDCDLNTDSTHLNDAGADIRCKGHIGEQFCATSSLTTTVVPRIHLQ